MREQLSDFSNYVVGTAKRKNVECNKTGGSGFRNPFDVSRSKLLEVVKSMQNNFSQFSQTRFFDDGKSVKNINDRYLINLMIHKHF